METEHDHQRVGHLHLLADDRVSAYWLLINMPSQTQALSCLIYIYLILFIPDRTKQWTDFRKQYSGYKYGPCVCVCVGGGGGLHISCPVRERGEYTLGRKESQTFVGGD